MFEVKNITKIFKNKKDKIHVLDGISFELVKSEFLAIVGPSGCGKTTLLRIISGLEKADAGAIIYKHKNSHGDFKAPIIWQDNRLFPWRTVEQNISFGLEMISMDQKEIKNKTKQYINLVKLNGFENYYPYQLSGGMQEKVAIARAMITEPDILLMDEPFASVDYQTKIKLFYEIKKLQTIKKLPIIYVTHDTRDAIAFADKAIVLSSMPAKIKKIINTKDMEALSMPLEKEIWELLEN